MSQPSITILLLEDNQYDAELTLHELEQQGMVFHCLRAQNREEFIQALAKKPDIILADYSLPQFNARQAIDLVQETDKNIPVIVVSGTIGEELAVEMMRHGAADYLMKDRLGRLSSAIQFALESAELHRVNTQYTRELEESNARYKSLFEDSPISLWEEDFSPIKQYLDEMVDSGIEDLDAHFQGNQEEIRKLTLVKKITAINTATLDLYEADSEEEALARLGTIFTDESLALFWEEIHHLYQGNTSYQTNARHVTLKGRLIDISLSVVIAPGYEDTWGKIFNSILDVTALEEARQQIAASEALLRHVIDSSPDSILVKNKDYTIRLANQAAADNIDTTIEEMVGKNEEDIGYPKEWIYGDPKRGIKGFRHTDQRVMEEGLETREIFPFPVGDETHYFEEYKKPLRNAEGEITSELVYSRDITEIVQAQKRLEASEKLLRVVIDSSPDSILVKDKDSRILLANQAAADDLGIPLDEMVGKIDTEVGYNEDQIYGNQEKGLIGFRDFHEVVFEQGEEIRRVMPFMIQGKLNYFDAYEAPLRDADGNITSALVYSRNITEIIEAQKELEQSEALLRSVFDSSSDWIFVKDRQHHYVLVNDQFIQGIGLPETEIIGKTDFEIGLPPEAAEKFQEDDQKIMETGKPMLFDDVDTLQKDGVLLHFSTMKSPLYDADGEIWGIMGIARDITERLHRESELDESRRNYEALFDSLVDGLVIHSLTGEIIVANPVAEQELGFAPGGLITNIVQQAGQKSETDQEYLQRLDTLREQRRISFAIPHQKPNGEIVIMEVNLNLVRFQGDDAVLAIMHDVSDVVEAEDALKSSEEQYRQLFNTVPDIIALISYDERILHCNQAMCDLTGYSYEEIVNHRASEFTTLKTMNFNEKGALPSYPNEFITVEIITKSKEIRLLEATGIKSQFGDEEALMIVGRDQTERIQVERKIQETERLLATMIDTIPQPIFVYDQDGVYVMVNNNIAELYQADKETILGKTNSDLAKEGILSPEEAATYHENAMIPLMTREPFFRPVDGYVDPDGIQHWFQIYTTPFKLPDNTMRVVGVGNEITHQMQAQRRLEAMNEALERRVEERTLDLDHANLELLKAKEQLESILQYSPDGFLLLDTDLNIQVMNPAFNRIIGIDPQKFIGKNVMLTVSPKNNALISNAIKEAIEERHPVSVEHIATHRNKSTFDCLTSISPIYSEDEIAGVVIGVHDITAQKEVQRMKDAFVSNVSHELRTPITNFICNLELIRMNPKKQDVYLDRLDQEIVQLRNIIEDLLRLSRFDQDAASLTKVPFDLNEICKDFTSLRTPLAEQKRLTLKFFPHSNLPRGLGDSSMITQVLSILLTNAINYTQPEGEIIIRSHPSDNAHPNLVGFSVTDNGPGISKEEQEQIFERFFRGQTAIDSNVSGTGLGLPIAQEIIQRHAGKIEVFSSGVQGEGATFSVWLPIAPNTDSSS